MKRHVLITMVAAATIGTASFAAAQSGATPPTPTAASGAMPAPAPRVQRTGRVQNAQERNFMTTVSTDSSVKKFMSK